MINKKVRLPKQAHKNANSDSRQTNLLQIGITSYTKSGICILSNSIILMQGKKDIPLPKEIIIPNLQYSISLARLLYNNITEM